jgi:hypothetical protein
LLQGFFKGLGVVKLINRLSPDSSLEQVPVNKHLQNFCLEDGVKRGLLEARAEDLFVCRGKLKFTSAALLVK